MRKTPAMSVPAESRGLKRSSNLQCGLQLIVVETLTRHHQVPTKTRPQIGAALVGWRQARPFHARVHCAVTLAGEPAGATSGRVALVKIEHGV
jgi:hypothetical protein